LKVAWFFLISQVVSPLAAWVPDEDTICQTLTIVILHGFKTLSSASYRKKGLLILPPVCVLFSVKQGFSETIKKHSWDRSKFTH